MSKRLPKLGDNVYVNVEALVESRLLVQANSGGGKSWAIRKLLEITHGHVQQILIDVDGEFHTLREKFDYVLAQKGGECPADVKSAAMLARKLLELGVSAIIDIYELGAQKKLFVKRFLESLVQAPRDLWHPVIVVLDEAHMFCPEGAPSESASAVIDLMTLGRKRGFCGVLATQRIAKLNKDAAAECNNRLIGRCALDVDMKRASADLGFTSKISTQSLRTLEAGEFFAFGPALSSVVMKTKIGPVETTHLRAGQRGARPAAPSAKVKKILAQLTDLPHEAEEEAKSLDEARAKVKTLEAELRKAKAGEKEEKIVEKTVEKLVIKDEQLKRLDKLIGRLDKHSESLGKLSKEVALVERDIASEMSEIRKAMLHMPTNRPILAAPTRQRGMSINELPKDAQKAVERSLARPAPARVEIDDGISKGERVVLSCLIQHRDGITTTALAVLTGYKATSRYEYLRSLRAKGLVDQVGDRFIATADGRKALPDVEPLPTGDALREWALSRVSKGERKLLVILIEAYPNSVSNEALESGTGFKPTSRYEYMRQLAARELVVDVNRGEWKANDTLFSDA